MKTILSSFSKLFFAATLFATTLCFEQFATAQNPTVIMDSLVVMQRVYAKEKLIVDQEAKFKQDIKVLGSARIQTDLRVDSVLRVDGTAKFFGNVKMEALGNVGALDANSEIVIILPNGQLKKGTFGMMASAMYELALCVPGDIANPMWANGINKIFSPCPQVNVGIGNNAPAHKLHVTGTSYATRLLAGNVNGDFNAMINGFSSINQDLVEIGTYNSTTNSSTVRFKIQNDGTVYAKEMWVKPIADFPDYVFMDDYQLMSLADLEKFIKTNGHLPKMPTATNISKFGMSLSEIQMLTVEKIEELTLHVINQNKKIEALQTQNNLLKLELDQIKNDIEEIKNTLK